jgi:hypothetical protein
MLRLLLLLSLLTPGVSSAAALEGYAGARLQDEQNQRNVNYRLVLSELKRSQATTSGELELRVKGDLIRRVWTLPEHIPLAEVTRFYSDQLTSAEVLYACDGLDCGSSHFWANEIFSNSRLVGRDQQQIYRVFKQKDKTGMTRVFVLYVVQRGTRQVMVNLDELSTRDAVTAERSLTDQIDQALAASHGWLPGFAVDNGELNKRASEPLIRALQELTPSLKRRLYLIVHCYEASHMADNIACSERLAATLKGFEGLHELNVVGQGALTAAPHDGLQPALRFIFWPGR